MTEQRHPVRTKLWAIALGCIAIVAFAAWFSTRSDHPTIAASGQKGWFTTDDGRTWFADASEKMPPFQKDGKTAYGCVVMGTADKSTQWVAYLYRFKATIQSQQTDARSKSMPAELRLREAMEVKKPGTGETGWVSAMHPRGIEIMATVAKDGRTDLVLVSP